LKETEFKEKRKAFNDLKTKFKNEFKEIKKGYPQLAAWQVD